MGGLKLRKLGVNAKNKATKQNKVVTASDFGIAGLIGQFERKYDKVFEVKGIDKQREIFGENINSTWYGFDSAKTFWNNLANSEGTLWIKSHVGYTGSAIDAVVASSTVTDQNGLASIVTLLTEMLADYDIHDDDAELAAAWAYHAGQETANHTPTDVTKMKTLDDGITKANNLKSVYNAHDADGTAHGVASSHQVTAANATDMTTLVALVNDLRTQLNAHAADAAQHTAAVDNVNFPLTAPAASETPASTLVITAGYQAGLSSGADEYGISGNRTGYQIENGVRFSTQMAAVTLVGDTTITVDSVIGIKIGDVIMLRATGATPGTIYRTVTQINESTNVVTVNSAVGVVAAVNDDVEIPGFKIRTYRQSLSGITTEVETDLGDNWCTMESTVTEFYVQNVHAANKYIKVADQSSASTIIESFPDEIPTTTLLTGGADGTAASTSAHWSRDLTAFDNKPVRMVANPETTDRTIQKAGEAYCTARDDMPAWVTTLAENQTEAQLKIIGSDYQRSDDFFQVGVAEWLKIDDDFNTAPNAPDRNIPNVGAVMGAWIRSISLLGIHYIPATSRINLIGINGIVNSNLGEDVSDTVRTDLAEYGINIIQNVNGFRIRNFFTFSTGTAERFANGLIMRNLIKVSSEDSLQSSENTPNSFNRILEDKEAIRIFLYQLWFTGSNGNVPEGETFGQQLEDGELTEPTDHFEVIADQVNNPASSIAAGERNLDVTFTFPAPAGSIEISVGILIR